MRKTISLLLGLALVVSCSHLKESHDVPPEMYGSWTGQGRFLDRDLAEEYGRFPVAIEIHPGNSVTGTVGAAAVTDGVIKSRPEDFIIDARLQGAVFEGGGLPEEERDCIVFLLAPPDGEASSGNIHLKTNHTFDPSMRVCGVELSRR